jgi:hypothetical protein
LKQVRCWNNATAKILSKNSIDIVLLGAGISDQSESTLRLFFCKENPNAIIVQHWWSGLLMSEICTALDDFHKKEVLQ